MYEFTFKKEEESEQSEDEEKVDPESYNSHLIEFKLGSNGKMQGTVHLQMVPPSRAINFNKLINNAGQSDKM